MARTSSSRRARRTRPAGAERPWYPGLRRRLLTCGLAAPLLACGGDVSGPARPALGAGASTTPAAGGAAGAAGVRVIDDTMRAEDPDLFALASRYFPGTTPQSAPARLSRLTRAQLDRSAQTLLPNQ